GYPERERRIGPQTRRLVFNMQDGLCQICGAPGTDIDHIAGGDSTLENLQVLCRSCHNKKTIEHLVEVRPGSKSDLEYRKLLSRIFSRKPRRPCDDEEAWSQMWRKLLAGRRKSFEMTRRDFDGARDRIAMLIDGGADHEGSFDLLPELLKCYAAEIKKS